MPEAVTPTFTFNLWRQPWITLERDDGELIECGIVDALTRAHAVSAIYDPSPLVIVGIHRLLTAILQAIYDPQKPGDLKQIQQAGRFTPELIARFGADHGQRFDLFSPDAPFMQSADLPLKPEKGSIIKSISQLTAETSRSTTIEHYRHGRDEDEVFCPACAARGLVTMPAFTSSGGRGLRPSINGVPPIYVIPLGDTLHQSLARSLMLPRFQPPMQSHNGDAPVWARATLLQEEEVAEVGYLESLTFPARRLRLHPTARPAACSRCGQETAVVVETMIASMGWWRKKELEPWQDPFVAYTAGKKFQPVRPQEDKQLWRDYVTLFLMSDPGSKQERRVRPLALDQLTALQPDASDLAFRCVGVRTDMKAKVFEWFDAQFNVPTTLLDDEDAAQQMMRCVEHAADCISGLAAVFHKRFNRNTKDGKRYEQLKEAMRADFWRSLAPSFADLVLRMSVTPPGPARLPLLEEWAQQVERIGMAALSEAAEATGDDGATLRQRVEAEAAARSLLYFKRTKFVGAKEKP